jgi:redox-sensitive bicupin YhaK (pirin superfamily)
LGNQAVIRAGEVQRMSAGTGIVHAEKNLTDESLHLYQLWFLPKTEGAKPSYAQQDFSYVEENKLIPVASDGALPGVVSMNASATIYLADLETGKSLDHEIPYQRGVFVYIQNGSLQINDQLLLKGDQARIQNESVISLTAKQDTRFVLIEVGL